MTFRPRNDYVLLKRNIVKEEIKSAAGIITGSTEHYEWTVVACGDKVDDLYEGKEVVLYRGAVFEPVDTTFGEDLYLVKQDSIIGTVN